MMLFGLALVESHIWARKRALSGKRAFMATRGGPMLPVISPPSTAWQARQLPLRRSKATCLPCSAAEASASCADTATGANARLPSSAAMDVAVVMMLGNGRIVSSYGVGLARMVVSVARACPRLVERLACEYRTTDIDGLGVMLLLRTTIASPLLGVKALSQQT